MTSEQARQFFLAKIRDQLSLQGTPLAGLELEYWRAMAATGEQRVRELWNEEQRRGDLEVIDNKFQQALDRAIENDLAVSAASRDLYLRALDDIKSADGFQLQAIVFGAAAKFSELTLPYPVAVRAAILAAIIGLLGLGLWIGRLVRR